MAKVVINSCYGGFGLSHDATIEYAKRKGVEVYGFTEARTADGHLDFDYLVPYDGGRAFVIHYATSRAVSDRDSLNAHYYRAAPARDDADLVAIVQEWGERANGQHAKLEIIEIPDDVEWVVEEYDGLEHIAEKHRTWS
jgi:hypothetical protein